MNVYVKEPTKPAQACVIWMHGLGADASDMAGLADELRLGELAVRHVFMNAPMRKVTLNGGMVMPAWYDIQGTRLVDREDKEGIEQSEQQIRQVMHEQFQQGFLPSQVFLAGFSQGGAMALHTALTTPETLGGVIALSAYLPLSQHTQPVLKQSTPFFMGAGSFDPLVLPQWSMQSKEWIINHGYESVTYHQYPMEHSICMEEINDLSQWLLNRINGGAL